MQSLVAQFAPQILIACEDGRCDGVRGAPQSTPSYSEAEIDEMKKASYALGLMWVTLSYVPITAWYAWRRPSIIAMKDENPWYHRAWNFMWMSHYFIYQIPAFVWPFTYYSYVSINHFYMLVNYWVGYVAGGIASGITIVLFLIAFLTFTESGDLLTQHVVFEVVSYIFLTYGMLAISLQNIVPLTYEYLKLSLESEDRDYNGRDLNNEGDDIPIGAFSI